MLYVLSTEFHCVVYIFAFSFISYLCDRYAHNLPFATIEVEEISGSQPAEVQNLGMYMNLIVMCLFETNIRWIWTK